METTLHRQQTLEEGSAKTLPVEDSPPLPPSHEVSTFYSCMPALKQYLIGKHVSFTARGNKDKSTQLGKKITSDPDILQTAHGVEIKFEQSQDQTAPGRQRSFLADENGATDTEIQNLIKKGVTAESCFEPGQIVSPIFVRAKKNGLHRMILNLKALNENVEYKKFKTETLQTALNLVSKDCFFASIDLWDAYYSVPIAEEYRKYFKLCWRHKLYYFKAAAMGLGPIPRIFTKLTKPILAHLHDSGRAITDDSLLVGKTQYNTVQCVIESVRTYDAFGFTFHDEKSQFEPSQEITYLGFVINSKELTVRLTEERGQKLILASKDLL